MLKVLFLRTATAVFINGNIHGNKTKHVPKYLRECETLIPKGAFGTGSGALLSRERIEVRVYVPLISTVFNQIGDLNFLQDRK